LVLAAVLILATALAWRMETSRDFGFHVATGRWILAHHQWPRVDTFTWTAGGNPYVDMHGLFQVVLAGVERGGMVAVGGFRVALVLLTTLLLWHGARRRGVDSPVLLGIGFGLGLIAWELRFLMRPELATYVLLALQLALLRRHAVDRRARWLALCVLLQLAWVYTHAFSLFGIATLGLYALADLVRGLRARAIDRGPWIALAAAVVTMFLNPYGMRGVAFLWELRTRLEAGNVFGESIQELTSPFAPQALATWSVQAFVVLLAATAVGIAVRARRMSLFDLAVTVLMAMLAITRVRNLGLFVVAVLPLTLHALSDAARTLFARFPRLPRPGFAGAALASLALAFVASQVVGGAYYAAQLRSTRFGHAESPGVFPVATLRRLESERLADPLFNTLDFGGYLIARRDTSHKIFIDGRLEVMGDRFYREYTTLVAGGAGGDLTRRFGANTALVSRSARRLVSGLRADSLEWALIDTDGAGILFARRIPSHREAIAAAEIRLAEGNRAVPPTVETFMPEALPASRPFPSTFPFEHWGRGHAFLSLGMNEAARREHRAALEQAGWTDPALAKGYLGAAYLLGRDDEARAWIRRYRKYRPDDPEVSEVARALGMP